MRVGIIGGGIGGLAAAYELGKRGHEAMVFEAAPQLGGLAGTFEVAGTRLEKFYKHIFVSDTDIIEYIHDLGLADRLQWIASSVGYFSRGKVYNFVTPLDLLRFDPISLPDRIRLGVVSLYLQRQADGIARYEGVTAAEWLRRYAGERNYAVVWEPLLRGKFGDSAPEVGMTWFWGKMRLRFGSRDKGMGRERLGYLLDSFGQIQDALVERVTRQGSRVFTGVRVRRVVVTGGRAAGLEVDHAGDRAGAPPAPSRYPCDAVIATVPSPVFLRLAPDLPTAYTERLQGRRYQAVMCLILVLKHPLTPIYWLNIGDTAIPFVAVIEQTNLIPPEHYQGKHIVYLSNYLAPDQPLYGMDADHLLEVYLPHLQKINPAFRREWIESYALFQDDAGQPIITTHYSHKIPDLRTPVPGLYLANTTQIYPEDRGQNYSIRLARRVVAMCEEDWAAASPVGLAARGQE
ncbi:MAG: NAD(P)/FAD-dependent oxidoreductase [Chloroflexi bacterium]|nr:NAD(P)/FAD-dependent oxidoreductase [Chloroflexota bacterium]